MNELSCMNCESLGSKCCEELPPSCFPSGVCPQGRTLGEALVQERRRTSCTKFGAGN